MGTLSNIPTASAYLNRAGLDVKLAELTPQTRNTTMWFIACAVDNPLLKKIAEELTLNELPPDKINNKLRRFYALFLLVERTPPVFGLFRSPNARALILEDHGTKRMPLKGRS